MNLNKNNNKHKNMNKLEQIEQQFNFKYPELYKELFENGMLDWGEAGPNRYATCWEKLNAIRLCIWK